MSVIGVDEVGRGPWAGPVVAAAVILPDGFVDERLTDSKKLSAKKRAAIEVNLRTQVPFAIGQASVAEIDEFNIREATFLAMERAILALLEKSDQLFPKEIHIDGNALPANLPLPAQAFIKGDLTHPHISAASILAKQYRDRLMSNLSQQYPYYAWESNVGYGTKAHQDGLRNYGVTEHHRRSFRPIAALLST